MRITIKHSLFLTGCIATFAHALPRPKPSPFLGLPGLPGLPFLGGGSDSDSDSDDEGGSSLLPGLPPIPALPPLVSVSNSENHEHDHDHDHSNPAPLPQPPPPSPPSPPQPPVNNFVHNELNQDIRVSAETGNLAPSEPFRATPISYHEEKEEENGTYDDVEFEDGKRYERGYDRERSYERDGNDYDDGGYVSVQKPKKAEDCDDDDYNKKDDKKGSRYGYTSANAY